MIINKKRKLGFTRIIAECNSEPLHEGDIVRYVYAYNNINGQLVNSIQVTGGTLITDLTLSEDE